VEAKKLATVAIHVATAAERPAPSGRPPMKRKFAEALIFAGLHPPYTIRDSSGEIVVVVVKLFIFGFWFT
jgi:hypothetical protein